MISCNVSSLSRSVGVTTQGCLRAAIVSKTCFSSKRLLLSIVGVMELRHLRYLLAVAEHGNFTRAAEALHLSQPTLSQQVRQLESGLGVQLLDRSGRTVR